MDVVDEIRRIAITILASVGGIGVIIVGISSWLGKIWADKAYLKASAEHQQAIESLKSEYNIKLEYIRAEIAERRDLLNFLQSGMSSSFSSTHDRILAAIEALWHNVIETQKFASEFLTVYEFLLPQEYEKMSIDKLENVLPPGLTLEEFSERMVALREGEALRRRPFIGEQLWRLYSVFNAFVTRLAWKVTTEKREGQIYGWSKNTEGEPDDYLFQMLHSVFDEQELQILVDRHVLGAPQRIMSALVAQMLDEMNRFVFGRQFVSLSLEERERIDKLLKPITSQHERPAG